MASSDITDILNHDIFGVERRQQPRIAVNWRTAIMFKTPHETIRVFGRTRDASATGICIECEQTIITETPVVVMIEIPSKIAHAEADIIQISGRIQNCILAKDKYRLGMKIVEFHGNAHYEFLKQIRTLST